MIPGQVGRALRDAEERIRANGLTGARAFEAWLEAARGDPGSMASLCGLAYSRFFPEVFKRERGQYFTPPPIVDLVVRWADPRSGETALDPACGSGAFLVAAARRGCQAVGLDVDPLLVALSRLQLDGLGLRAEVVQGDLFEAELEPADVLLANPPFSLRLPAAEPGVGAAALSEGAFVRRMASWVRPGGRAAVVLPWSVAANPRGAPLRAAIDAEWVRTRVCALPEGVFRPFAGAAGRAVVVWLRRRMPGDEDDAPCRYAELRDPGYDVRRRDVHPTDPREIESLHAEDAWTDLVPGAWLPRSASRGVAVSLLARARPRKLVQEGRRVAVVDLCDSDRNVREVTGRRVAESGEIGRRMEVESGDLLFACLRPELGNLAVVPEEPPGLTWAASPEWIALRARLPHFLRYVMATPAFRELLGPPGGQTHPRVRAETVLEATVAWPGQPAAERIDALGRSIFEARAALHARQERLQGLVDAFAAGQIDADALAAGLDALESGQR